MIVRMFVCIFVHMHMYIQTGDAGSRRGFAGGSRRAAGLPGGTQICGTKIYGTKICGAKICGTKICLGRDAGVHDDM